MLFTAFALAAATAATPPPTIILQDQATIRSPACPAVGVMVASAPSLAPSIQMPYVGPDAGGIDHLTHMPPVALMAAVARTIGGCNAPIIEATLFDGKPATAPRTIVVMPGVAPKP